MGVRDFVLAKIEERSLYSKAMQYLFGIKDIGKGLAIMTAENPSAKTATPEENNMFMKELKKELKRRGKVYFSHKGKYVGPWERSLLITNVSKRESAEIANDPRWKQDSFIYVKRVGDGSLLFFMIRGSKVIKSSEITTRDLEDLDDGFSEVAGRRFSINFSFTSDFWD